jgi:hypothetical protein
MHVEIEMIIQHHQASTIIQTLGKMNSRYGWGAHGSPEERAIGPGKYK